MDSRWLDNDTYIDLIVPPAANPADGTHPSTYKDVSGFERFAFLRAVGVSDDASCSMQVVQATAAAGTGKKNVTSAASTVTSVGSAANNKWAMVSVETSQLDSANGFRYVAVDDTATGGSATAQCIFFFAWRARESPVTQPTSMGESVHLGG